jgi:hypothetical protein
MKEMSAWCLPGKPARYAQTIVMGLVAPTLAIGIGGASDESQSCSLVADSEDGISEVEEAFGLTSAGACEALSLGGGPSSASLKVFFTLCQKLLVKTSFICASRVHHISRSTCPPMSTISYVS